jgi:hypothetical protein
LIAYFSGSRQGGTARSEVFQIIDPAGSPSVNSIGTTVLDVKYREGGAAADPERSWYVYVDNDTNPLVPAVFLFTFAPSGTTECWEWMGVGAPMTLVGGGSGISSTQFTIPNVIHGGGNRSIITSRIEIGDPYNQDFEDTGGRRFYWRAIGSGGPNVGTFYASTGESYPDTVAPIAAGSLQVEAGTLLHEAFAYYKFDTDLLTDETGTYPLINSGAVTNPGGGLFGNCADFSGVDQNQNLRINDNAFNFGNGGLTPASISIWINPDVLPGSAFYIVHRGDAAGNRGWMMQIDSAGVVAAGNWGGVFLAGGSVGSGSGWHHICWVNEVSIARLYVDGVEVDTAVMPAWTVETVNNLNFAKADFNTGGTYFDGQMDEAAFWDRALTLAEVTALYNSGTGLALTGTVQPATTPSISGNTITNITPDDGSVLYSVTLDLSTIGFGAGAPGRLMGDLT